MTAKADSYIAQTAWSEDLTGLFTVADSDVGGDDIVGGTFGHNVYDTLPDPIRIEIRRGRASDFSVMEQGTMLLTLPDPDGDYNPENTSGPLYALLDVMRPTRTQAVLSGTTYDLYHGFNSRVAHRPAPKRSIIPAVDLFEWLARSYPTIAVQTNARVDTLIGLILDAVEWTDPNARDLDASRDTVPSWSADASKSALTLISDLLATDLGWFFVSRAGKATYRNRDVYYLSSGPTVLGSPLRDEGLEIGLSMDDLVNSQTVTRSGGVAQTATDTASIQKRGLRVGSAITSDNLASDDQALGLANFIVSNKATPRAPARVLGYRNTDAATLQAMLSVEIADLVTVPVDEAGNTLTGRVQTIQHTVESGKLHDLRLTVRRCTQTIFEVAASDVGGDHVVGF